MQPLAPDYLAEIARQLGSLSAFLGGFAAAFLGTLLAFNSSHRLAGWAIRSAAFAAFSFIVVVVATTKLVMVLHPHAPAYVATTGVGGARILATLGFLLGTYALLLSVACSGWLHSRAIGIFCSVLAAGAALLVTGLLVG